jgi:YjbE family integral membrane protein
MELLSTEFFSALLAIIIIDLVLAGDNAIVIALAARNLPPHLRKKAVMWGTFGAIAVRTAMTLIVVWLLKIPGLMLLGGALLVWIAYKLLAENDEGGGHQVASASTFWGAMKTIVVADAVMGLDNVLAVAGAAQGSFLLVVLGLLISIPVVIWGSQLILKWVERFPIIVYIGGGVLAWTAAKMMLSEPLVKPHLESYPLLFALVYAVVILGVLGAGFLANHSRTRSRVARHLVDLVHLPEPSAQVAAYGAAPVRVLVPVDGSPNALRALRHVIAQHIKGPALEVHLVHVRTPFSQHVARFIGRRDRDAYHGEVAARALKGARALLERHGVPHAAHVELGDKAEMINRVAQRLNVARIVMGTARKNSITRIIEDSVTGRVLDGAQVPVEVIGGEAISRIERVGVPSAVVALLVCVLVSVMLVE